MDSDFLTLERFPLYGEGRLCYLKMGSLTQYACMSFLSILSLQDIDQDNRYRSTRTSMINHFKF